MKKLLQAIVLSALLLIRPVYASITIDPAEFGGKTKEWIETIVKTEWEKMLAGSQDTLIISQGFSMPNLKEYLTNYIKEIVVKYAENKIKESSAQKKNAELLKVEQDNYVQGIKAQYNKKYEIAQNELEEEQNNLAFYESMCNGSTQELAQKKAAYETAHEQGTENEATALSEYTIAMSLQEDMCNTVNALKEKIEEQKKNLDILKEEMSKVGTEEDPRYRNYQERTEAINKEENQVTETIYQADVASEDWGSNLDAENYEASGEDYTEFYERYFYNPSNINVSALETQTKSDKVKRERNFLLINTTAHLLQVSASARREVPTRSEKVQKNFNETKSDNGEYAAINALTTTKIENIRALLLYAKLLSAKLQYATVHDLQKSNIQLERDTATPDKFKAGYVDMEHYILTDEYVKQIVEESNNSETTDALMNVQDINTEWRPNK